MTFYAIGLTRDVELWKRSINLLPDEKVVHLRNEEMACGIHPDGKSKVILVNPDHWDGAARSALKRMERNGFSSYTYPLILRSAPGTSANAPPNAHKDHPAQSKGR